MIVAPFDEVVEIDKYYSVNLKVVRSFRTTNIEIYEGDTYDSDFTVLHFRVEDETEKWSIQIIYDYSFVKYGEVMSDSSLDTKYSKKLQTKINIYMDYLWNQLMSLPRTKLRDHNAYVIKNYNFPTHMPSANLLNQSLVMVGRDSEVSLFYVLPLERWRPQFQYVNWSQSLKRVISIKLAGLKIADLAPQICRHVNSRFGLGVDRQYNYLFEKEKIKGYISYKRYISGEVPDKQSKDRVFVDYVNNRIEEGYDIPDRVVVLVMEAQQRLYAKEKMLASEEASVDDLD